MATAEAPPYGLIADCLHDHSLIPFLGSAASSVGALKEKAIPTGSQLAERLAADISYPGPATDSLLKIAQFMEDIAGDRPQVLKKICTLFFDAVDENYSTAFSRFLSRLPKPLLPAIIITTNYDISLERTLQKMDVPYMAVSHILRGSNMAGRFFCYRQFDPQQNSTQILTNDDLNDLLYQMKEPPLIIYKIHGSARLEYRAGGRMQKVDTVVLTETDYVNFMADNSLSKIPDYILEKLRSSRLLFLGYALEDWNFRVLMRRIARLQRAGRRPEEEEGELRNWAILRQKDEIEMKFWQQRKVNVYQQPLEEFLAQWEKVIVEERL